MRDPIPEGWDRWPCSGPCGGPVSPSQNSIRQDQTPLCAPSLTWPYMLSDVNAEVVAYALAPQRTTRTTHESQMSPRPYAPPPFWKARGIVNRGARRGASNVSSASSLSPGVGQRGVSCLRRRFRAPGCHHQLVAHIITCLQQDGITKARHEMRFRPVCAPCCVCPTSVRMCLARPSAARGDRGQTRQNIDNSTHHAAQKHLKSAVTRPPIRKSGNLKFDEPGSAKERASKRGPTSFGLLASPQSHAGRKGGADGSFLLIPCRAQGFSLHLCPRSAAGSLGSLTGPISPASPPSPPPQLELSGWLPVSSSPASAAQGERAAALPRHWLQPHLARLTQSLATHTRTHTQPTPYTALDLGNVDLELPPPLQDLARKKERERKRSAVRCTIIRPTWHSTTCCCLRECKTILILQSNGRSGADRQTDSWLRSASMGSTPPRRHLLIGHSRLFNANLDLVVAAPPLGWLVWLARVHIAGPFWSAHSFTARPLSHLSSEVALCVRPGETRATPNRRRAG